MADISAHSAKPPSHGKRASVSEKQEPHVQPTESDYFSPRFPCCAFHPTALPCADDQSMPSYVACILSEQLCPLRTSR